MAVKIQLRRDTASNWETNNPVLLLGEIGLDTTSGNFKIGNGTSQWTQLNYFSTEVEDVISEQQLNDAIAAIGGDGIVFDSENGVYNLDLSSITQNIVPNADVTYDLGSSTKKWKDLYLSGNTIFLGGIQLKDNGDGTFGVFSADGETNLETILLPGQVTDNELSGDSADIKARFAAHRDATNNPHSVTAEQVGLGNVINESKATMFTDPTFTGTVSGVTATHVGLGNVTNESKATMFTNAALTGIPTAPTAAATTSTTQIATTEFVQGEINAANLALGTNFSVADIAARDALTGLTVGDIVFVADDGDSKWAQYKVTSIGPVVFLKIMDQDVMLNSLSAANIKSAYESNADTNAFTDAIKTKLETTGIVYTVENYTAANALPNLIPGDLILVLNRGDGKWELSMYLSDDTETGKITITSLSVIENAYQASSIKSAYESNADTNAFTDALQTKLNGIEENAKDDQNASEVSYTDTNQTYALGIHVQDAIYAIDDELISLDGRLDIVEGDDQTTGSIAKALKDAQDYSDLVADDLNDLDTAFNNHTTDPNIHFTQAQISITESQISDFGTYEPADATILKQADVTTLFADPTFTGTVTGVTASMVGLGSVTNESKATMFANPEFTGIPIAPTASTGTNTTQIATTAFVQASLAAAQTIDGGEF